MGMLVPIPFPSGSSCARGNLEFPELSPGIHSGNSGPVSTGFAGILGFPILVPFPVILTQNHGAKSPKGMRDPCWNSRFGNPIGNTSLSQERQGIKSIHGLPLEYPRPLDKDWSHLECLEWDGLESLGFTSENLPVGNHLLFPEFPWQTWERRIQGIQFHKKPAISIRKSVIPVWFSCQEDSVIFRWVNPGWSTWKNQLHPIFFP